MAPAPGTSTEWRRHGRPHAVSDFDVKIKGREINEPKLTAANARAAVLMSSRSLR